MGLIRFTSGTTVRTVVVTLNPALSGAPNGGLNEEQVQELIEENLTPISTNINELETTVSDIQDTLSNQAQAIESLETDITAIQASLGTYIPSDPTGLEGASAITNIVSMSQVDYDNRAILPNDASTLFIVF